MVLLLRHSRSLSYYPIADVWCQQVRRRMAVAVWMDEHGRVAWDNGEEVVTRRIHRRWTIITSWREALSFDLGEDLARHVFGSSNTLRGAFPSLVCVTLYRLSLTMICGYRFFCLRT